MVYPGHLFCIQSRAHMLSQLMVYGLSVKCYSIVTTHVTKTVYIIHTVSSHNETLYSLNY
jgi:hypothetical protein